MEKPKGYDTTKAAGTSRQLPIGGYICKIKEAKEILTPYWQIAIAFDIVEGEESGFFEQRYKTLLASENSDTVKWPGAHRIFVEDMNTHECSPSFKGFITAVEESNPGYIMPFGTDKSEKTLAGKLVGLVFRQEEFKPEGKDVLLITRPAYACSVETIRTGKFKVPGIKKLKVVAAAPTTAPFTDIGSDEECPF